MKKLMQIIVLCIMLSSTVFAANFDEINMKIEIPEEYYDLKEGIESNDAKITYYEALLKTTKEELTEQIKQNGIIYYGKDSSLSKSLTINKTQSDLSKKIFHLHLATDSQMNSLREMLIEEAQAGNMKILNTTVYEKNGTRWLETILEKNNDSMHQYFTIINGDAITISLDEINEDVDREELKSIIDTVEFSNLEEKAPDFTNFIIIGATVALVIIVVILMVLVFSKKKEE